MKEETRRHPETGFFTLQSELRMTPARGGTPHLTFSCSFSPGVPRRRALHTAPIKLNVWGEHRGGEGPKLSLVHPESVATGTTHTVTLPHAPSQPQSLCLWRSSWWWTRKVEP